MNTYYGGPVRATLLNRFGGGQTAVWKSEDGRTVADLPNPTIEQARAGLRALAYRDAQGIERVDYFDRRGAPVESGDLPRPRGL